MLVQHRGICQVKSGKYSWEVLFLAGTGLCFKLGYKLGNRLMIRFLGWGGGNGVLCFSLGSRVRGNDVGANGPGDALLWEGVLR